MKTAEPSFPGCQIKAVICDVYHTLLEVQDGPEGMEEEWKEGWQKMTGTPPPPSPAHYDAACEAVVALDHAAGKAQGEQWPEVDWRSVVRRAAPGLVALDESALDALIYFHTTYQRSIQPMPGAWEFLMGLRQRNILTGIASNAQQVTLTEMERAGYWIEDFPEELCFWSFQHAYSKPDPRVFSGLADQLDHETIHPHEILMIGDRMDNDILPARAAGWLGWHFTGEWPVV